MNILTITRGVELYFDHNRSTLHIGRLTGTALDQYPLELWFTFRAEGPLEHAMIVNVSRIKQALRDAVGAGRTFSQPPTMAIFDWAWAELENRFAGCRLTALALKLNASLTLTRHAEEPAMLELTTSYELAASHRLTSPGLDQAENETIYGKCANPSGHGHNYQLEVTLSGTPDPQTGQILPLDQIDRVVREHIIEPFDHKNLNHDTTEFKDLTPTVENMVQVFYHILRDKFAPTRLQRLRIWETPKTYAEYAES